MVVEKLGEITRFLFWYHCCYPFPPTHMGYHSTVFVELEAGIRYLPSHCSQERKMGVLAKHKAPCDKLNTRPKARTTLVQQKVQARRPW